MEYIPTISLRKCLYYHICIQIKPKIHSYPYSHLYKDISTATPIPVHIKPEISKSWTSLHSSLQSYMKYFHELIAYYIINYHHYPLTTHVLKFKYRNDQKFEKVRRLFYPSHLIWTNRIQNYSP